MKTPSLKSLLIISQLILILPAIAQAEPGSRGELGGNPPPHCDEHRPMPPQFDDKPRLPPYLRDITLSEAQEDKVFAIVYAQVPIMRDNEKQKRKAMDELAGLTRAASFDEKKAQQLADKLAALTKEAVLNRTVTEYKIFSLLTPDQRSKAQEPKDKRPDHHGSDHNGPDQLGNDRPVNFKLPSLHTGKFIKA